MFIWRKRTLFPLRVCPSFLFIIFSPQEKEGQTKVRGLTIIWWSFWFPHPCSDSFPECFVAVKMLLCSPCFTVSRASRSALPDLPCPGQTRLVLSQPSWVGKPIKALCESGHEEGHREPHFLTLSPRYILQHSSPELQGTVGSKFSCFDPHQSVCGYAQLIRARHDGEVSHTFPMLHFPPPNDSLDFLHPLQCWNFLFIIMSHRIFS